MTIAAAASATATTTTTTPVSLFPAGALALSPEQVAAALGVPRTKIYQLLASGAIRSVKIGKYRRVPTAEVTAYLERELEEQRA